MGLANQESSPYLIVEAQDEPAYRNRHFPLHGY